MINPRARLMPDVFGSAIAQKATRDGFGTGSIEAGTADKNVVVLCADLTESTRADKFKETFPDRFIEMGIAEQNMAATAAGFALAGKIPFIASYAAFSPGRNYEQIRTTIALNQVPVKIMGMHAGVSVGPDGATHQMLEDLGLMRMLPHMIVLNPGDAEEARKAVVAAAKHDGPVYIRFGRSNTAVFTTPETPFEIGKALTLWRSGDSTDAAGAKDAEGASLRPKVAILSTGSLSYQALLAARSLESDGIGSIVVHVPTIKPLDEEAIVAAAKECGRVVTVEEHQAAGGFGSAVAECLSELAPVPILRLGILDEFGQSGDPDQLITHYGLDAAHIAGSTKRFLGA